MSKNKNSVNKSKKYNENDKVSLGDRLEVERLNSKKNDMKEGNFIPNFNNWTSSEEQKIKTTELEK